MSNPTEAELDAKLRSCVRTQLGTTAQPRGGTNDFSIAVRYLAEFGSLTDLAIVTAAAQVISDTLLLAGHYSCCCPKAQHMYEDLEETLNALARL